jgi:hypothetical protein
MTIPVTVPLGWARAGREAGRDRILANERADDRRHNTHFPDRADRRRTDGNDHLGVSRHKIARHYRQQFRRPDPCLDKRGCALR